MSINDIIYFDFNEKSSVLLLFFFNAVVFSFLLLKNAVSENRRQSKWLAAFIILGALYICPFMFGYANWYAKTAYREFLFFMPFQQLFLLGPVFYFYVRTLLNSSYRFTKKDLIHFLPAILYLLYSLVVFVTDKILLDEFYFYADNQDKDLDFWYQMAGLIAMLFYLFLSLKYYLRYRILSLQEVSYADEVAYRWVKHFTIAFGLILLLRVLFFILNPEWGEFGSKYWYYVCFSILLLYITISGYTNTIKASLKPGADLKVNIAPVNKTIAQQLDDSDGTMELGAWKTKITELFETEDIYKKPNLTLTDLADLLSTNRNIISKAINQEFKMNFNDFVNQKRAEAVIQNLKDGQHLRSTLLGIALDCGFNSKATFNRAFKKHTGITPKQYIVKNEL